MIPILTIKDSICFGNLNCEDSCGWSETFAFVIDGASGLSDVHVTDSETDAKWLAENLAVFLQNTLGDSKRELTDIFHAAAKSLKETYNNFWKQAQRTDPPEYPSAGVAAIRIRDSQIEYFGLGDCTVVVETFTGKRVVIVEKNLTAFDKKVIDRMTELSRQAGCSVLEAKELLKHELIANRKLRNRQKGYWIFDPTGAGVPHGRIDKWPVATIKAITLMTDGFAQLVNPFGFAGNYDELHCIAHQHGVSSLVQALLSLQQSDADCTVYPRFKVFDDITALLIECK